MTRFHTGTTRAAHPFMPVSIVFVLVLSVAGTAGLLALSAWVGENIEGTALFNYLLEVGEALGAG